MQIGHFDECIDMCQRLLRRPDSRDPFTCHASARHNIATCHAHCGRHKEARAELLEAMKCPVVSEIPLLEGEILYSLALFEDKLRFDIDAVIGHYKKCIELLPQNPRALHNLGNKYRSLGLEKEATVSYQRALAADSTFTHSAANLAVGMSLIAQKRWKEALRATRSKVPARPPADHQRCQGEENSILHGKLPHLN